MGPMLGDGLLIREMASKGESGCLGCQSRKELMAYEFDVVLYKSINCNLFQI
jgi:hypothetical protein